MTVKEFDKVTERSGTAIQEFYRGSNILLTGGTGFMGKVLLEKLLRSCPGIDNVFLLIRSKKGKDVDKRLDEIFDDVLFTKLKEESPKFRHKVSVVSGDCSHAGLGISSPDRLMLSQKVDVVFHGAATVRFDEKLKLAVGINVHGTKNVLDLAREMPHLKAIIHISTAYSHCTRSDIDEKFYNTPLSYEKVFSIVDSLTDKALEEVTPGVLEKYPNTYVFTKAVAEEVVRDNSKGLPIAVFRPAIVVGTRNEPMAGWIDNLYGPTGVIVGVGVGMIKTLNCDSECLANIVPVDMAVNALIASAWDVANSTQRGENEIPIYNYVSSVDKPLNWSQFLDKSITYGMKVPTTRSVWYYSFRLTKHRFLYLLQALLLHFLPALVIDSVIVVARGKPKLLKMYKKIHRFSDVIAYFSLRAWNFSNKNVNTLWDSLSAEDQKLFDFDIRSLDWDAFLYSYVRGVRVYLLKDDISTVPQALARWRRLYWIHQGVKTVLGCLFLRMVWPILSYGVTLLFT